MAFSTTGFATIGASKKGNAPSIYSYSSADAIADVNTEGYFNSLSDTLAVGIVILLPHINRWHTRGIDVLTNASGVVDVTDWHCIRRY
jgi:hypothetical protein